MSFKSCAAAAVVSGLVVAPTIGQVPEPTTVAMLFAGLAALRRRRKSNA